MNTKGLNPILDSALANVSYKFRPRIISIYLALKRNCLEYRFDAAGLSVGKFSETILRYLQDKIAGAHIPFGQKISNFVDECNRLIASPATRASESERILLPRALVFLYTMRNKRGIGHVGGDVDANQIDTAVMARISDWIICEMIRLNHNLSLEEAQDLVDSISVRELPAVWEVAGKKRVLKENLQGKDKALLLLYSSPQTAVLVEDLCEWIEYSNIHMLKVRILKGLHKARMIEHDKETDTVFLSPKGAQYVEENLL